jgi:protein TonB
MFSCKRRALTTAVVLVFLAACSGESPQAPSAPAAADGADAAASAVAPITDEAGLRAAATKALAEQRFYAPAGNSALDHYLALRELRPDDANLATALLELLPYAVIGIEQAVARNELDEARRLLGLLERADPQAPSLVRLRDSISASEAAAAEALAKAERDEAARLAAEQDAQAKAAQAATAATAATAAAARATPAPTPAAPVASAAPAPTRTAPPPVAAPASAPVSAPVAAAPAPAAPAPVSAAGVPRLLSAPSPRYPIMAQRRKLEGQVTVKFTIQPDGSVASPSVVSASPPGVFDEAALVAASRWRFEAGSRSVPSSRVVQFRLGEGQR